MLSIVPMGPFLEWLDLAGKVLVISLWSIDLVLAVHIVIGIVSDYRKRKKNKERADV